MSEQTEVQPAVTQALPGIQPPSVTTHSVTIGGRQLRYTATAGFMRLTDDTGKPKADVFYMAYTADTGKGGERPVTFAFNGGPGSSSVWLHCGALGPKRLDLHGDGAYPPVPPYRLIENEQTWLAWTDLVFIDPVGTGFSRPAGESKREEFHGVTEDVASVGAFIRRYTSENNRWMSPKFLAGESYGTTRAAALANYLQSAHGMSINGIALISSVLSFQTIAHEESPGNDLPYLCFLPAIAATAWYHGLCAPAYRKNFATLIDDTREFSTGAYATLLAKGYGSTAAEERAAAAKISAFTGLPRTYIER
ncbi:MAG: peptidase S10, partial [Candidatus Kapabacteria bacterium]|nr:peptidase S10 [Candidatus Kapabacteria bacterium]